MPAGHSSHPLAPPRTQNLTSLPQDEQCSVVRCLRAIVNSGAPQERIAPMLLKVGGVVVLAERGIGALNQQPRLTRKTDVPPSRR